MGKGHGAKSGPVSHYPAWYESIQRHAFIPAIILVEGIVYGLMFTWGLAPKGSWDTWDITTQCMVGLMFVAGFLCGGMVLRCSLKSAVSFGRGSWGFGLVNFVGIILFIVPEIWAGIVERSAGFPATPPDRVLLSALGFDPNTAVVLPSVIAIAVLPAAVGLFYGFSEERSEDEDPADIEHRAAVQEAKVRAKARVRNARALGWADTFQQVKASVSHEEGDASTDGKDGTLPMNNTTTNSVQTPYYDDAPEQAGPNVTPLRTRGKGNLWTASDLVGHVLDTYGYRLSQGEAVSYIKAMRNATQLEGVPGKPWAAHRQTIQAWARKHTWPSSAEGTA